MANVFDDSRGRFLVLANTAGQYSLWPATVAAPAGWARVYGEADREACLAHVREHWTDLRPHA
ncbi:protein mbtH [Kitasatospora sp. MMS16-BH015]|uniref:MbtH family protein n=1 Tax=Kitasatospora sp. MMS16-BH015 TaxID=2018025 RepID=UPI000CA1E993|nr:MbtH family protein [Kitasatospora sp. MMS16-BH015]AUG77453.1 protein mbtH [Kitasatospora sp. MMS16-BH015]